MRYRRVLLKLSGETLAGAGGSGIDPQALETVVAEIAAVRKLRAEIAVVIGAGNFWRGAGKALDRVTADHMGMLATVMNSLALGSALNRRGISAGVMSAVAVAGFAEQYSRDLALQWLAGGKVVILGGGTGNPYFTTDTTAALRAAELDADVLLKATQVDGIYTDDPKKNPSARKYDRVTYDEAINKRLRIMDTAAFTLCREKELPILVFDFHRKGNLAKALGGKKIGTVVTI